ncbi:hypothetical protein ACFVVA_08290 [Kitasatospora sp. NPDC058048]|uniref:hypothetical protein n=1 Tax=Kitasatospora sp. NPDC058048 TaxID=3346313 RepID=UPI0036D85E6E
MTNNQAAESLVLRRSFPPCRCAQCGDSVPEARVNASSLTPAAPAARRVAPPSSPYRPSTVGERVFDVRSGRWAAFMGWQHGRAYLRPLGGGIEWDAEARWITNTEQ